MQLFYECFSEQKRTEHMARGRVNEESLQKSLGDISYMNNTYGTGLMEDIELSGFDCSTREVALLDM